MEMKSEQVLLERAEQELKMHPASDDKKKSFRQVVVVVVFVFTGHETPTSKNIGFE